MESKQLEGPAPEQWHEMNVGAKCQCLHDEIAKLVERIERLENHKVPETV